MHTPANTSFFYIKWGVRGYTFQGHVIPMNDPEDGLSVKSSYTVRCMLT